MSMTNHPCRVQTGANVDLSAIPTGTGAVSVSAGETWTFQMWYRDVGSSNFTNAAEVAFR